MRIVPCTEFVGKGTKQNIREVIEDILEVLKKCIMAQIPRDSGKQLVSDKKYAQGFTKKGDIRQDTTNVRIYNYFICG